MPVMLTALKFAGKTFDRDKVALYRKNLDDVSTAVLAERNEKRLTSSEW